jgi:hypothetical protein
MSAPQPGDANGTNAPLDPSFAIGASNPDTTSFFHQQFHQEPVAATPPSFSPAPLPNHAFIAPQAQQNPGFSAQTAAILARAKANIAAHSAGTASYEAAREQLMKNMVTSDQLPVPAAGSTPKRGRGGRGRGRGAGAARSPAGGDGSTPGSTSTPASERGRGKVGRPRGRGRGGGRGGKRKRSESAELSDVSKCFLKLCRPLCSLSL